MYDKLWEKQGIDRLKIIDALSVREIDEICRLNKKIGNSCGECPLALFYRDVNNYKRLLCVDVATRRRVENAFKEGGRFLEKGEMI